MVKNLYFGVEFPSVKTLGFIPKFASHNAMIRRENGEDPRKEPRGSFKIRIAGKDHEVSKGKRPDKDM